MSLKKAVKLIRKNKRFLITTHINAEGDALGSALAFYRLVRALGKEALIVIADDIPYGYDFLPGIEKIRKFNAKVKNIPFDCFVALDCSDLGRSGSVGGLNKQKKPMLNIDHHISNDGFADVNWIEPHASSTSEMIYKLYKAMRVHFSRDTALLLYVGIMTDSGSFRYPNTTSFTHQAAAELLKYKINVTEIHKKVYENIPLADARLLSKILPTMGEEMAGKIIWFQIKRSLLSKNKISFDISDEVLGFARAIKGVEAAVLFKENLSRPDEIRVNFRSQGKIDVNRIARCFGGGGHKTASGCTIKGSLDSVRKKVLAKIKENFR
jgi:phosphoesterase RecJ-like protein